MNINAIFTGTSSVCLYCNYCKQETLSPFIFWKAVLTSLFVFYKELKQSLTRHNYRLQCLSCFPCFYFRQCTPHLSVSGKYCKNACHIIREQAIMCSMSMLEIHYIIKICLDFSIIKLFKLYTEDGLLPSYLYLITFGQQS